MDAFEIVISCLPRSAMSVSPDLTTVDTSIREVIFRKGQTSHLCSFYWCETAVGVANARYEDVSSPMFSGQKIPARVEQWMHDFARTMSYGRYIK